MNIKSNVKIWNEGIAFNKMYRMSYNQLKNIDMGEHVYYVNMNDEITGAVYEATVIGKTEHLLILECRLVKRSVEGQLFGISNSKHVESFAFIDALWNSHQRIYANIRFTREECDE